MLLEIKFHMTVVIFSNETVQIILNWNSTILYTQIALKAFTVVSRGRRLVQLRSDEFGEIGEKNGYIGQPCLS